MDLTDEELAKQCADGIDSAEKELLRRHMQAIYWMPHHAFGADEEDLSGFLIFAVEKIRLRETFTKFDPDRGVRFTTWFSVILRNLYLDFLRTQRGEPAIVPFDDLHKAESPAEPESPEDSLLHVLHIRCRTLFKLLLCNTYLLTPDEIQWLAKESKRSALEIAKLIANLESALSSKEEKLQDRYDKLATVHWWKQRYEKKLRILEGSSEKPYSGGNPEVDQALDRLTRRRDEYERIAHDLSGTAGIATAPYHDLAELLQIPDGTLASHISRCRAQAADYVRRQSQEASHES